MPNVSLITYLDYIATWEDESDENINQFISGYALLYLSHTPLAAAIIGVIKEQLEAYARLPLYPPFYPPLPSPSQKDYEDPYDKIIESKETIGLDVKSCKAILMQFIGGISKKEDKIIIDSKTFKKYAGSARIIYNHEDINKVYDALNGLDSSPKSEKDVKKCMDTITNLNFSATESSIVQNLTIGVMSWKIGVPDKAITTQAKEVGLASEIVESSLKVANMIP
jgi:hypothetical protein